MSDIIEEKEIPVEDFCDKDEYIEPEPQELDIQKEKEAIEILKALKGHKLEGGGVITGASLTFTNKKTKEKRVVRI